MRRNPVIYEINTWVWLAEWRKRCGHDDLNLGNLPDVVFNELIGWNLDVVWLMGIWERSPRGREIAQKHPDLQGDYHRTLPGFSLTDVIGSPYAVHNYEVDPNFGGREALAKFRARLHDHGIGLILDYVPNHTATDHPLTHTSPDCYVNGDPGDAMTSPHDYFEVHDGVTAVLANGRDPYFPPWTDTAQIDAFSPAARQWTLNTLRDIATQCDGVRCDMAMLMVNRIFANTWAHRHKDTPETEFWSDVIPPLKKDHPDFVFLAEVYWDMEAELQGLGFDYTYDKRLYDRMRHESPSSVRDHLLASLDYQSKLVRFTENHDEPRAISAFGTPKSRAAAVLASTLPGARLFHEGQFEGRKVRLPVQLGHRPQELPDDTLTDFYKQLLAVVRKAAFHDGVYMTLAINPILGEDSSCRQLIAFAWAAGQNIADWQIVVVNLGQQTAKGRVMLPYPEANCSWRFVDALHPALQVTYTSAQLHITGLPIELGGYESHLWSISIGFSDEWRG